MKLVIVESPTKVTAPIPSRNAARFIKGGDPGAKRRDNKHI